MSRAWRAFTDKLAPEGRLSGGPLLVAALVAAAAAAFWGLATRLPFVASATFLTQVFFAWVTPGRGERLGVRVGTAFMAGGMWAAIGMLLAGR